MLSPRKVVLLAIVLCGSVLASASEFKQGEVIVKYKEGILRTRSSMGDFYRSARVKKVRRYSRSAGNFEQLILNENTSVEEIVSLLKQDSTVEYVQPNYILHILPVNPSPVSLVRRRIHRFDADKVPCWFPGISLPVGCDDSEATPAKKKPDLKIAPHEISPPQVDPELSQVWGIKKVNAIEAWQITRGSKDFIVADIDTGLDYNHADISYNVWRNPNPSDKNDVAGFDFIHNDGLPFDDQEHGTHTAGTIGAVGGNGIAISGINQTVSLMALKFIGQDGSGTTADAIRAIDYAIDHGAKVLSNSWGGKGDPDNKALYDAIERARVKGVLFVAAAGNDTEDNDKPDTASYPAGFNNDNLISVAATDSGDALSDFSNYGKKTTHLAAPGSDIYSTVPGDQYKKLSGTSMACPHVAGAAALLWSQHPTWDYKKVKSVLISTVDVVPSLADKVASGGRLNVLKALQYKDPGE